MQSANMIFYVIGAIVIVLFILLLVNMLLMRNKLNRLAKKYKYFMNGEDGGSLELLESVGGRTVFAVSIPDQPVSLEKARSQRLQA